MSRIASSVLISMVRGIGSVGFTLLKLLVMFDGGDNISTPSGEGWIPVGVFVGGNRTSAPSTKLLSSGGVGLEEVVGRWQNEGRV